MLDRKSRSVTNLKLQNISDTVNAVDISGKTREFIAFIPNANGTANLIAPDGTGTAIPVLSGHIYPFRGKRINSTGSATVTAYVAIFTD